MCYKIWSLSSSIMFDTYSSSNSSKFSFSIYSHFSHPFLPPDHIVSSFSLFYDTYLLLSCSHVSVYVNERISFLTAKANIITGGSKLLPALSQLFLPLSFFLSFYSVYFPCERCTLEVITLIPYTLFTTLRIEKVFPTGYMCNV